MPMNHVSMYAELTPIQSEMLGRFVTEWSNIEQLLGELLGRLLFTPPFLSRVYADALGANQIQEAISKAVLIHRARYGCGVITHDILDKIDGYREPLNRLRGMRNRFAHFCWARSNDDEIFGTSFSSFLPGAAHFNETASLAYLLDDHVQVIDSIDSLHEMRISNRPGRVLPPHCSAMGKAITAFQTREQVDRILEAYGLAPRTSHSIVDRRDFVSHLIQVRETGVAYDREESTLGGICIAAAIQMPDGRAVAAVSVSTPVSRMTAEREPETAAGVLNAAQRIAKLATQEE